MYRSNFRLYIVLINFFYLHSCQIPSAHEKKFNKYFVKAKKKSQKGLLRESLFFFKQAHGLYPEHVNLNLYMASNYLKLQKYKSARKHLLVIEEKAKDMFEFNFLLGEAYRGLDDYAESIFFYRKAQNINPDEMQNLKALAWSYYKIRYYKEAIKVLIFVKEKDPSDQQAYIIQARILSKLKRYRKAISTLNKGLKISSRKDKPYFLSIKGDIYFSLGQIKKAKKFYQIALKSNPLISGALLGLGRCLFDEGEVKKALVYMEQARRLKPNLIEIYLLLARSYELVNKKKSLSYYIKFKKMAMNDPDFLEFNNEVNKKIKNLKKQMTL